MDREGHELVAIDGDPGGQGLTAAEVNAACRKKSLVWLRGKPLCDMVIARNTLVPLQRLQRSILWLGSSAWEVEQRSIEARALSLCGDGGQASIARTYPLIEAAEGALEGRCLDTLWKLVSTPDLWSLVDSASVVAEKVGLAFRMVSRAGCLINMEYVFKHSRFPFALFIVVKNPHMAPTIKDLPQCLRCPFSAEFMSSWDIEEERARCMLLLICKVSKVNISDIECRHAWARRLLARCQTHKMKHEDFVVNWLGFRLRKRKEALNSVGLSVDSKSGGDAGMGPGASASADGAPAHSTSTKQIYAPGSWRAFIATETSNKPGSPDFRVLGEKYRNLSDVEKAACVSLAKAVKESIRGMTSKSGSLFGLRRKDRENAVRKAADDKIAVGLEVATLAPDISARGSLADEVIPSGQGVDDALATARREVKLLNRKRQEFQQEQLATLSRFCTTHGELDKENIPKTVSDQVPCIHPSPCAISPTFTLSPSVDDLATRFVEFGNAHAQSTNIRQATDAHLDGLCKFVYHKECPAIDDARIPQPSRCFKYGVCVCSVRGRAVHKMRNGFYRWLKSVCPRGSARQTRAREAFCFVEMKPVGWDGDELDALSSFYHIGYLTLKPYEAEFQEVLWDGIEHPMGRVELEQTFGFFHDHQLFDSLEDLSHPWAVSLFRLDHSQRPLPMFDISSVSAYRETEFQIFYTPVGGGRGRQQRRPRMRPPPVQLGIMDIGDVESDDEGQREEPPEEVGDEAALSDVYDSAGENSSGESSDHEVLSDIGSEDRIGEKSSEDNIGDLVQNHV